MADKHEVLLELIDEWERGGLDMEGTVLLFSLLNDLDMLQYLPGRFRRYALLLEGAGLLERIDA